MADRILKAIILAAGLGTRLRPIIGNRQKTMLEYLARPLLQRTVEILRNGGFKEIIMVVGFNKEEVINYFGDGSKFGVKIEYVVQKHPKGGTADAVRYAKTKISEEKFLLIYGDNIFHPRTLDRLIDASENHDGVMCGKIVDEPQKFGVLEVDSNRVVRIHEKPEKPPSNIANTGLFVLPREIFTAIEETPLSPRGEYELTDSIQVLINKGFNIGYILVEDFWMDPQNEEDIQRAREILSREG